MDPEQVDEFVMGYLKKKGFNNGTSFSSIDYHNDPDLTKLIRSFSQSENDPSRYREGYSKLRSWAYVNQKEIHWGLLEDSLEDRLQKTGGLLSDSEKGQGESKADSKKRSSEIGKQGSSVKKLKKDKAGNATAKVARQETSMALSTTPRVKPELAMPVMSTDVEESILEDLRNRVQLSSLAMPSVSFYTFVNTHNGLNSSSISHDGSLVAGGFSDSSIKVWDMAKIGHAGSF